MHLPMKNPDYRPAVVQSRRANTITWAGRHQVEVSAPFHFYLFFVSFNMPDQFEPRDISLLR